MKIDNIYIPFISPTGGVKKIATAIYNEFNYNYASLKCEQIDLTSHKRQRYPLNFSANDLIIWCIPTFAGRIPTCLNHFKINGNGAIALMCNVYGNRAVDDAPRELAQFLTNRNFKVIGYATAIAQHSLEPRLGTNRPDAKDLLFYRDLVQKVMTKVTQSNELQTYIFDYSTPFKPHVDATFTPIVDKSKCDKCGMCYGICPEGIIEKFSLEVKEENIKKCMTCMACVAHCPLHGRSLPAAVQAKLQEKMNMVYENNKERKDNELFLA